MFTQNISPREENLNVGLHIEMNICTYNVVGTCNSYTGEGYIYQYMYAIFTLIEKHPATF